MGKQFDQAGPGIRGHRRRREVSPHVFEPKHLRVDGGPNTQIFRRGGSGRCQAVVGDQLVKPDGADLAI